MGVKVKEGKGGATRTRGGMGQEKRKGNGGRDGSGIRVAVGYRVRKVRVCVEYGERAECVCVLTM